MLAFCVLLAGVPVAATADTEADKPSYPSGASSAEKAALDDLAKLSEGALAYSRKGRIWKVEVGRWAPVELGKGEFVRWSADGSRLAVYDGGKVFVMDADGKNRTQLVDKAWKKDGASIEFHPNGKEVLFLRTDGVHAVHIETKNTRKLNAPGKYTGELCISADGNLLAARWTHDLYLVDLKTGRHSKFARGCSPGVSPDGTLVMNNDGGHCTVTIRHVDSGKKRKIEATTCKPDGKWDNHHWSNHNDFIAAQGDGKGHYGYVLHVPTGRTFRLTWDGGVGYPDFFVGKALKAGDKGS